MRSPEEKRILFAKFDRDVATRSRLQRLAIATDQFFAVLFWNTSQDETISSQINRRQESNRATWFDNLVCKLLQKLEYNHCKRSEGE